MRELPDELLTGPFTRARAGELGVSSRMLEGRRFVRLHPRVWRHRDHQMTEDDHLAAARLALPAHARLTGISRIQQLGLDFGPRRPLRFVVEGDLHLALDGIFLHRTCKLPPDDDDCVSPAAAYLAYCARARVIDAIKVGDWLLHGEHLTLEGIAGLCLGEPWRDGADEAGWILSHLDRDAASVKESEVRAVLEFAGLPPPEINAAADDGSDPDVEVVGDLVYRRWGVVVEYEGKHHQEDRRQYVKDIGRYAWMRGRDLVYVQVTQELLSRPRSLVGEVFRALVSRGYDGPAPELGEQWRTLFSCLPDVVPPSRRPGRAVS